MQDRPKQYPSSGTENGAEDARVDVFRAAELAAGDPRLDEVMVRETLEGEPVSEALGLIRWAKKKSPRNPYRLLRRWARRHERGFYSPARLRRDAGEVYREYLAFVETKREEHEAATGSPVLPPDRLDAVTRTFYAPRSRADLARISPAVWAQFHEELEAEDRQEDVA